MKSRVMRPWFLASLVVAALSVLGGCQLDDSGYKAGELGNGGFYFSCDDAAACSRYTNDASKFPKDVAVSSTFGVRFVPKTDTTGIQIHFNDSNPDRGIVIQTIGDFVSKGPKGLTAVKTGYTSIVARDAAGFVIDYTVIQIAKPDSLVVFAADDPSTNPPRIERVALANGERRAFRAFAQKNKADLAGSLQVDWKSDDPTVAEVENTTDGKVTIIARKSGSTMLKVRGATFEQVVPVEVTQ